MVSTSRVFDRFNASFQFQIRPLIPPSFSAVTVCAFEDQFSLQVSLRFPGGEKPQMRISRRLTCLTLALTLATSVPGSAFPQDETPDAAATKSPPIQHLVVIFQENVSFDHYFATYPNAMNPAKETPFTALPNTPGVNGISGLLMTNNPNLNASNGTGA